MVYIVRSGENSGDYSQRRLSIGVVDRDNSMWSQALEDYLEKYHDVTVMEDDMDKLAEGVYTTEILYAVIIPEDFYETCILGNGKVESVTESGSQWEYYVNGRIDDFINSARVYLAGGYSQEEFQRGSGDLQCVPFYALSVFQYPLFCPGADPERISEYRYPPEAPGFQPDPEE